MHKHNAIFNKTATKLVTILTKCFFPYPNPTSYLNKAFKRPHHAHPTSEDILSRMNCAKYFTKLDAYWLIELDEESSKLLTFNSLFGRYQFLRMPYGIHSASDNVYQQKITQIIDGILTLKMT